ncbi:unnamed protein product [Owenia fusiformis]|uniref:Uncharacterized protein n=1 Tax=Owenia fusiformis TaxID=6347 RepID=A0A8S4PUS1_OWEFU|nr:unnamed protein product [Owenia fusiformis]
MKLYKYKCPTGSGKTQLALLYAKKFTNKNNDSTCFCFNSSTPEDILVDVTSSDDNDAFVKGFENLTLEVKGYSKADVDALNICQYNQFKGKDMQNLAKKLDYLPLGIHAACQYIIESKGTKPKLLDQLKGGKEDALDSLFQLSHIKACKECEQDEKAKLLLNVVAALSPDPIPFDVLDWMIGSGNEDPFQKKADRSIELDKMAKRRNKIIDSITRFHLGTVEIKGSDLMAETFFYKLTHTISYCFSFQCGITRTRVVTEKDTTSI